MLVTSPARKAALAEARKLLAAGDREKAYHRLIQDRYDHGIDPVIDAEILKHFPVPLEHLQKLAEYRKQFGTDDAKERQKAVKRLSRFVLGSVSNTILEFVRHPETAAFLIEHMSHPDPVVQEHATIALARALDKYVHDDRATAPLVTMLDAPRDNTRGWALEGLASLTDEFLPHALRLQNDKSARVRDAADAAISLALSGGGTMHRPPLGEVARRQLRDAMLAFDLKRPADERVSRAWFLAQTAEPADLPVLREWHKKDGSKQVKEFLKEGIDRLAG